MITNTPQTTVFANGSAVAVWGAKGSGHAHGPNQHQHDANAWSVRGDNTAVRIECHAVSLTGDRDTCGHVRIGGSSDIFIGEDNSHMACQSTDIDYITPEGITTLYTPSAQRSMGTEAPGVISQNDPPGAIMQDKDEPPAPEPGPPASCEEFTDDTPDSVQLSTNFNLAQVSTQAPAGSHRVRAQCGLTRPDIMCNLKQMCTQIAEPVLERVKSLGHPRLTVSSGFRALSGNGRSHHYRGAALDLQVLSMKPTEMFELAQWISTSLPCDQIILEGVGASHHWIHVSLPLRNVNAVSSRILTQTGQDSYTAGLFLLNYNGSRTA